MSRRIRHPSPLWATCFSILLEQVLKNVLRPLSEALGQLLGAEGSQISKKDIVIIGADLLVETSSTGRENVPYMCQLNPAEMKPMSAVSPPFQTAQQPLNKQTAGPPHLPALPPSRNG
ncbi:uncharacterized protein VK521_016094 isoform 1-T1 [Ammospiza maritima maritima]